MNEPVGSAGTTIYNVDEYHYLCIKFALFSRKI